MNPEVFTKGNVNPSVQSTLIKPYSKEDRFMDDLKYFSKREVLSTDNEDDERESVELTDQDLQDFIHRIYGVQEWHDGSKYKGEFGLNMKLGYGVFEWSNGEKYRGQFYKDHRHGRGIYSWPDGCTFTGTFYLSHREGYGTMYLKSRVFQGLYKADERFGPGIESYSEGCQDVGWWYREHLIKLCTQVRGSFTISDYPEFIPFLSFDPMKTTLSDKDLTKWEVDEEGDPFFYDYKRLLLNDNITLPPEMYIYSTDNDHLPMTVSCKKDFDFYFFVPEFPMFEDEDDPCFVMNQTPLMLKIQKHTCKFRHRQNQFKWNVNDIMNGNRSNFGYRGPKELVANELILKSEEGDYDRVYEILRDNLALADVGDVKGFTALGGATVHCHNTIINLLLDNGANVNVCNDEGITPLCMCFILYYPKETFKLNIAERNLEEIPKKRTAPSAASHPDSAFRHSPDVRKTFKTESSIMGEGTSHGFREQYKSRANTPKNEALIMERGGSATSDKILDDLLMNVEQCTLRSASTNFESNVCLRNYPIEVSQSVMMKTANAYPILKTSSLECKDDDPGTVRKMALSIIEHKCRWMTIQLLLKRGADPNYCTVPMQVLFFPIKAADVAGVQLLLEHGARTDIRFPTKMKGLTPLHIAVSLPVEAGIKITELLLHTIIDPDARAEDQNERYKPDKFDTLYSTLKLNYEHGPPESYYTRSNLIPEEGGRTPLHVVCEREDNFKSVRDIIRLLLIHKANPNILWSGHSPLTLCIASGNDLSVQELLLRGADPNLSLTKGVGSAICAVANLAFEHKRSLDGKIALVDKLIQFGADILHPIKLVQGEKSALGTAVDYAYFKFFQDRRIAHTPFHALTMPERETLGLRKKFLEFLGARLRKAVLAKEDEWDRKVLLASKKAELTSKSKKKGLLSANKLIDGEERIPFFKYCYQCGRSIGVRLAPCLRCYGILTCSKHCKAKAWNESHKRECGADAEKEEDQDSKVIGNGNGEGSERGETEYLEEQGRCEEGKRNGFKDPKRHQRPDPQFKKHKQRS